MQHLYKYTVKNKKLESLFFNVKQFFSFHAYGLLKELDDFEENSKDAPVNQANTILKHKTSGGLPPGAGVREDVILIFEELEEARSNLNQIRSLIEKAPEPKKNNLKGKLQYLIFFLNTHFC